MTVQQERRRYHRLVSETPVEVIAHHHREPVSMANVSEGGLAFLNGMALEIGRKLKITIPHVKPPFEAECIVCRCRRDGAQGYEIGVRFVDEAAAFRVRMIEQMRLIMQYRQACAESGRELSFNEAAAEWISQYAATFGR